MAQLSLRRVHQCQNGYLPRPLKNLKLAETIIMQVRSLLPYGAGNQIADSQRTMGQFTGRTALAMKDAGVMQGQQGVIKNLMRMAGAAANWGSGNCQEQAAVTYCVLRETLPSTAKISYCTHNSIHHVFATIGELLVDPANQVVIVDPWPINAQAVHWDDHFCYEPIVAPNFNVWRTKFGGKAPSDGSQRVKKHIFTDPFESISRRREIVPYIINLPGQGAWNHQWCARTGARIDYTDDIFSI